LLIMVSMSAIGSVTFMFASASPRRWFAHDLATSGAFR